MEPNGPTGSPGHRWIRTGSSSSLEIGRAVEEALGCLDGGMGARLQPLVVLAFASSGYDLDGLASSLQRAMGATPVLGCTTSGELACNGSLRQSLVVWALGGEGFSIRAGLGQGGGNSLRQAAVEAARCIDDLPPSPHRAVVLLADGLCGDQMEVVRGAYEVVGAAVPLVGGCAGDDQAMVSTHQFFNGRVLNQAVVALAIGSDAPLGIGVSHGWQPHGAPMLVTESHGVHVRGLNDRPALDVYLEALEVPEAIASDPQAFSDFAATHPLGIRRRDRIEIRYISGADFQARSLTCIAEVPQGGLALLMQGDATSVLEATGTACQMACDGLEGQPAKGLLLFDCVARRAVLEAGGLGDEIARVQGVTGDVPMAGFYTYGEIARTHGAGGFHNQTLVVLALA